MEGRSMKLKNKYITKDTITYGILLAWSTIISLQCSVNPFRNGNSGNDSSVFRYMAYAMKEGLTMYKDSFDHKGPMIYWINYLGMSISFWRGVWVIEFLTITSTLIITYRLSRLFHGRRTSLMINFISWSMIFVFFQNGNLVEEYALPFIALSLYIYIDYYCTKKVNILRLVLCGASFMVVFLLRANMTGLWVVFCGAIFIKEILKREWKKLCIFISTFTLGAMIVLIPNMIYLVINGALGDFIDQYFVFNMMYSKEHQANYWNTVKHFLDYPIVSVSFLIVLVSVFKDKKENRNLNIVYLISMVIVFLLTCMSGRIFEHYAMVLIPMTIYPFCILFLHTDKVKDNFATFVIITGISIFAVIPFWNRGIAKSIDSYSSRHSSSKGLAMESILSVIRHNSDEDDLITVYGINNSVYVLGNRLSASKYSYQYPIGTADPKILDEYFEELEKTKPRLVILEHEMDEKIETFLRKYDYVQISNIKNCNIWMYEVD